MSGGGKLSAVSQLINLVQGDLRTLSSEARRKHPAVKESVERAILKLRHYSTLPNDDIIKALQNSDDVLHPLLFACETKNQRFIQLAMSSLQRLISQNAIPESHVANIVALLCSVTSLGIDDLRVLQTIVLMFTATPHVHGQQLAKVVAVCFRLHSSKDPVISNTAIATMRQLVTALFERMAEEEEAAAKGNRRKSTTSLLPSRKSPVNLPPCAQDAYLVFQDVCQLTNGDPPYWLSDVPEISRTLGLELLETLLSAHPEVFLDIPEFSFMLKERVCPLVIRLFSPSIKYNQAMSPTTFGGAVPEKPSFPVCLRLLRIVGVLIKHFYVLLVTECEIFLSLLVKFLEIDKPIWQRVLAVEVLHQLAVQPRLLRSFCYFYDLQEQSTKVFADIICSLHIFIQNQLQPNMAASLASAASGAAPSGAHQLNPDGSVSTDGSGTSSLQTSGGNMYREGFLFGGTSHAVLALPPVGTARCLLLQMLDKVEAPQVAEGYSLSEGVSCLLDTVHSVGLSPIVDPTLTPIPGTPPNEEDAGSSLSLPRSTQGSRASLAQVDEFANSDSGSNCGVKVIGTEADSQRVVREMVKVSSKDILGSLSLLLDASQVASITEAVLRAFHTLVGVCGRVDLDSIMQGFLLGLCRSAQPTEQAVGNTPQAVLDDRTMVMKISPKKLQCTKCLLSIALVHGQFLHDSWQTVLECYQTMFTAMGLQLQASAQDELLNQNEGTHLALLLQQLCQNSSLMHDNALLDLLSSLCNMLDSTKKLAKSGREPVPFSCQLLVLCCKVNLQRLKLFWNIVVNDLLNACRSSHAALREMAAKALTTLIPMALSEESTLADRALFHMVLLSLSQMSEIGKADVCHHQLSCVFQILQSLGDKLSDDWNLILDIIGSSAHIEQPAVVQLGFEALQLVAADYLALLPLVCLTTCLDVASKFGLQTQDLNISLTAVGLLWNMSDFLCHHQSTIEVGLPQSFICPWLVAAPTSSVAPAPPVIPANAVTTQPSLKAVNGVVSVGETTACDIVTAEPRQTQPAADKTSGRTAAASGHGVPVVDAIVAEIPRYDCLWCSLFYVLSRLCVDERPAVRKSAAQTLFSTVDAHGHLLVPLSWNVVLWKVLFPLLECVQHTLDTVEQAGEKAHSDPVVVVHHSRNTKRKQWAETQVLTLQGISGIFSQQLELLAVLSGFHRAWDMLLSAIHSCVSEGQGELATAALRSLHQLLLTKENSQVEQQDLWQQLWQVWRQLALQCAQLPTTQSIGFRQQSAAPSVSSPNAQQPVDRSNLQNLLALHMQQFVPLRRHLSVAFKSAHIQQLKNVLDAVLSVPADQVTLMTCNSGLTPLQEAAVNSLELICKELQDAWAKRGASSAPDSSQDSILFTLFELLLQITSVSTSMPSSLQPASKEQRHSCVLLGEAVWRLVLKLFLGTRSCSNPTIMLSLLKALHIPLACKYSCPSHTTWMLALEILLEAIPLGLAGLRQAEAVPADLEIYSSLLQICEDFLFPASDPPGVLSADDRILYEEKDVQVVYLIRDEILSHVDHCPPRVLSSAIDLLNRGSVLSQTSPLDMAAIGDFNLLGREQVARACFETLLNCSVLVQGKGRSASVALESLVRRCCTVLERFQQDEKLSGECPLPRSQLAETSFVLHAVALMLQTMKDTPASEHAASMWQQLIQLYPSLVSCVTCNSSDVRAGVQKVLSEYAALLTIPSQASA